MFIVNLFANGDHVCIAWRPAGATAANWTVVADCLGFAIERRLARNGQTQTSWLRNRIGFHENEVPPAPAEAWRWPIQRYMWWDYDVEPGDQVAYRVVPVLRGAAGLIQPNSSQTPWSAPVNIGADAGGNVSAWFNRGVVATQWVARALKARQDAGTPKSTLMKAVATVGDPLREALAGHLKPALLELLRNPPGHVYAALYELNDPEIIDAFVALGNRCHMILGNGAFKAPETDENEIIRGKLRETEIDLHDRIVGSGHYAHNKFIVFCDAADNAVSVWTGSTNLTVTGLCTQVNNGLLVSDPAVASDYLMAWRRLERAGNGYGGTLIADNSTAETHVEDDGSEKITAWFAATSHAQDLEFARDLIDKASDGILFLFFNPGVHVNEPFKETLLQTIIEKKAKDPIYVRGVVNQEIEGLTEGAASAPVNLVHSGAADSDHLPKSVLVPSAIAKEYGDWEAELKGASSVMVHSKVVVLDPFGDRPVVMTGSHNLGFKASSKNDDNLIIIQGNAKLAQAYAANIVAIFQEYRWRDYVANHQNGGWRGLEDNDSWQKGHLEREAAEMMFWVPEQ